MPGRFCTSCSRFTHEAVDGRCPECAPAAARADTSKRQARRQRDGRSGKAWRQLRLEVIERDGGMCTVEGCGQTEDLTAHRIGGGVHDEDLDAYVTLCRSHHGSVDAAARRAEVA